MNTLRSNASCTRRLPAVITALLGALLASTASAANDTCADKVIIKRVLVGYVDAHKGPDNGNAVAVSYLKPNGQLAELMLNRGYNLNDTPGPALLSTLLVAQTTGQRVTLKDHFQTRCDDFDEVILEGY